MPTTQGLSPTSFQTLNLTQHATHIVALLTSTWPNKKTFHKRCSHKWVTGSLTFCGQLWPTKCHSIVDWAKENQGGDQKALFVMCKFRTSDRYEQIVLWARSWANLATNSMGVCPDAGRVTSWAMHKKYKTWTVLTCIHPGCVWGYTTPLDRQKLPCSSRQKSANLASPPLTSDTDIGNGEGWLWTDGTHCWNTCGELRNKASAAVFSTPDMWSTFIWH